MPFLFKGGQIAKKVSNYIAIEQGLDLFLFLFFPSKNVLLLAYHARPHCVSSAGQSFTPAQVDRKTRNLIKCC
jgi:hypothetical protein